MSPCAQNENSRNSAFQNFCIFSMNLLCISLCIGFGSQQSLASESTSLSATWWNAFSQKSWIDSAANPSNRYLQIPDFQVYSELRPELKTDLASLHWVLRPKFSFEGDRIRVNDSYQDWLWGAKGRWSEAFVQSRISDELQLTYGLQNFQWGPAEAASPSNPIFRDSIQVKDILYDVKGKHLLRVNWTPKAQWTEVLLVEPGNNGDPEWEAGESFAQKALLKSEVSWNQGSEYTGATLCWRDRYGISIGEYINLQLFEGWSFYIDAFHQKGSLSWYPTSDLSSGTMIMNQAHRADPRIFSFVIAGLRYAFENGNDFRVEGIFDERAYSKAEQDSIWNSLSNNQLPQIFYLQSNLSALSRSGMDMPGNKLIFSSFRIPDVFHIRDFIFYARMMFSVSDGSASGYTTWELPIGEGGVAFVSASGSLGNSSSELAGSIRQVLTAGYRHSW